MGAQPRRRTRRIAQGFGEGQRMGARFGPMVLAGRNGLPGPRALAGRACYITCYD